MYENKKRCIRKKRKEGTDLAEFGKLLIYVFSYRKSGYIVGNPNRKKMHIFGFVGIFEYIC